MTIKQQGGIFGRNPTFNDLTAGSGSSIEGSGGNVTFSVDRTDASTAGALVLRAASGNLSIDSDGADKDILIRTGGSTERARFYGNSGDFSIKGNLVVDSGQGIDFSATSGTGTSELFSDYEEGVWTPANDSMTVNSGTFAATGTYVKIGKLVFIDVIQTSGTVSAGSGAGMISGFPFTPARTSTVSYSNSAGTLVGAGITETNSKFYGGTAFSSQTALRFSSVYTV